MPLDDKGKGFISSTTIPVFKYLVDPQMLGVSNSMICIIDGLYRLRHPAAVHSGADTAGQGDGGHRKL